ncbi:serine hydrolase [Solitalea longa]|uniref:Serine hydrolase n=1 Tax=Solitalea longa TaxID=2079460 RepID=A0A2S4ZZU3_9SPHI|nr:serine hydrolase domain-containing protein [Solitalea longa]POY35878.1 serine hydrolase [Solitalea longa]
MNKLLIGFVIFCITQTWSYGQTKQDKQLTKVLDDLLSEQFKSSDPGCAVLIAKGGQIVYQKGVGSADLELNVSIKPDMIFRIGSMTKQFTAIAILQLVEQNKISLKDSIQKFIKDFPFKGNTITIENLLTHTSGIVEYTQLDIPDPFIRRKDFTPKEIIDLFKDKPLEFLPGTKFKYSNSGYFLLGYIIEGITNKSYKDYIQESIITPLGLTSTHYDDINRIIPNRVKGYKKDNSTFENADYQSSTIPFSAGALISNNADLFKWNQALYNYTVVRKETLEKAFTPFTLMDGSPTNYGFGWFIIDMDGNQSVQHGGNINGFRSNEIYFPKEDVFVSTLFNCECAPMEELSEQIAFLAIGKVPHGKKAVDIEDSIMNSYVGKYIISGNTKRPIIISKENGQLFAGIPGEWKAQLIALSKTKFDIKDIRPSGTIDFFTDASGKIVRIVTTQSGKEYEAIKTE